MTKIDLQLLFQSCTGNAKFVNFLEFACLMLRLWEKKGKKVGFEVFMESFK
jgi:hypothetical protein